jgi:hypothetical protein
MKGWIAMIGLLLVGGAQAAEQAQQFDLVCRGKVRDISIGRRDEPTESRYRIDLSKNQWCEADCQVVRTFAEVTPTRLFFEKTDEPLKRSSMLHGVDRTNGEWFLMAESRGDPWSIKGICEPAQFSGIAPKTKF